MYFSRVTLAADADPARVAAVARADAYRVHQFLWKLFPGRADQPRDFLFRRDEHSPWPGFYLVSAQLPEDRRGLWQVATKPYRPALVAGDRLAFELRANPVVTRSDDDSHQRHDVVMDAKRRLPAAERPILAELAQQVGFDWLARRAEGNGFAVTGDRVRVDGYRRHQLPRDGRLIRFSTLEFNGVLTVTDPERMVRCLFTGVGPAKGFGCGLLLVRRV